MTFLPRGIFPERVSPVALAAALSLSVLCATGTARPGHAQTTYTWTGASTTSDNWSDTANWLVTAPPVGGSADTSLTFAASPRLTPVDDLGSNGVFTLNTLSFNTAAGNYVLGGTPALNFTTFSATDPTLRVNTTSLITINSPLSLSNSLSVGTYSTDSGGTLIASVNQALTLNGTITGTATTNLTNYLSSLTLTGGGTFGNLFTNFTGGPTGSTAATSVTGGAYTLGGISVGIGGLTGNMTISGASTSINTVASINGTPTTNVGQVKIGSSGTGTLTLQNGATLSAVNYFVGYSAGVTGTGTVTGKGTTLTAVGSGADGALSIASGAGTTGTLTLQNGGSASVGNVFIGGVQGGSANATGTLNVTAPGLAASGASVKALQADTIVVGNLGTGTLSISGGGNVSVQNNVFVGENTGSTGNLTMTDANSTLNVGGILEVGGAGGGAAAGTAKVNLTNATLTVAGNMNLYGNATGNSSFTATNSTLTVGGLNSPNATSLGITLTNSSLTFGATFLNTSYNGNISGMGGGITKAGTGTTSLTGSSTYTGGTFINFGTLAARGTALSNASAITVLSGGTLGVGEAVNSANSSQAVSTLSALALTVEPLSTNTTPVLTFNLGASGISDTLTLTSANAPLTYSGAGSFLIGFASATGSSLSGGTYNLINFATPQTLTSLPLATKYAASAAGNLKNIAGSQFIYLTNAGGQVTALQYSFTNADALPEPSAGALALSGMLALTGVFTGIRRRSKM